MKKQKFKPRSVETGMNNESLQYKRPLINFQGGRTLIGLCASMAVITIATAISAPQLTQTQQQLRTRNLCWQISDLSAQMIVLAKHHQTSLELTYRDTKLILTTQRRPQQAVRIILIPKTVSVEINTPTQQIVAYPTGSLSPGRIKIKSIKGQCDITLSLRGRVRSEYKL